MITALVVLALASAEPSAPTVVGPRTPEAGRVTYVFRAHERGLAPRRIGFRCSVDAPRLHACPSRYSVTLMSGLHTLRVRAVDPAGRAGPSTTVRLRVPEGRAPAVPVGDSPLNVIAVGDTIWTENYGDGTISAVDVASGRVTTISVGGQPGGIAYGAGSLWVSDLAGGTLARVDPRGGVAARISLGGEGAGVAFADGVVYVADYAGGLTRVDAATNRVLGRTSLPGHPEAVAVGSAESG